MRQEVRGIIKQLIFPSDIPESFRPPGLHRITGEIQRMAEDAARLVRGYDCLQDSPHMTLLSPAGCRMRCKGITGLFQSACKDGLCSKAPVQASSFQLFKYPAPKSAISFRPGLSAGRSNIPLPKCSTAALSLPQSHPWAFKPVPEGPVVVDCRTACRSGMCKVFPLYIRVSR